MLDFNPFDMDFDGDVEGIDFLGLDHLMHHVLGTDRDEATSRTVRTRSKMNSLRV